MPNKKATLLGATGLIGGHLLELLQEDETYTEIKLLVRRQVDITHPKVNVAIIDFEDRTSFQSEIIPESVIFCAVGTTSQKVKGNKDLYRKVDYDIPVHAAQFGLEKGCQQFILVSSLGANPKSSNFYSKLKGEVEEAIKDLKIPSLAIFRPSLLLGQRKESRFGESVAKIVMTTFSFVLPSKIRPIQANDVAEAMLRASKLENSGVKIYHRKEIKNL